MNTEWCLINRPFYTGIDETKTFEHNRDLGFADEIVDTPLSDNVILCKGNFDGTNFEIEDTIKGIVQNNDSDSITKDWERQLLLPIGVFKDYQYVKFNNRIWLIMTSPQNNHIYEKVILNLCKWIAKWQDEDLNIVHKPFVVLNASQYNSGTEGDKRIQIGYNQFWCYTALDKETVSLPRDKRMFIDYNFQNPIPYKITRPDTVSYYMGETKVMSLIFTETQYNPQTDRIDLMLCDYKEPVEISKPVEITYNGEPQLRCGGRAKTFTANTDKPVKWNIKMLDTQKDYIVVSENENKISLKCLNNNALIGSSLKLVCICNDVESELLIEIVGGV